MVGLIRSITHLMNRTNDILIADIFISLFIFSLLNCNQTFFTIGIHTILNMLFAYETFNLNFKL